MNSPVWHECEVTSGAIYGCFRLDLGEALPDWREYDLLVVMGGG